MGRHSSHPITTTSRASIARSLGKSIDAVPILHSPVGRLGALGLVGVLGCFAATGGGGAGVQSAAAAQPGSAGQAGSAASVAHDRAVDGALTERASSPPREPAATKGAPIPQATKAAAQHEQASAARGAKPATPAKPTQSARWLPTGTGMWIFQWSRTEGGNAKAVVAKAKAVGLSTLYVRSGGQDTGFDGAGRLGVLLPLAHAAGIKVVAWDFPTLADPKADAARLAAAANFSAQGQHVDGVAPDIETPAEGTHLSSHNVSNYLYYLRHAIPGSTPILVTVPWPSQSRLSLPYPYQAAAAYADAIVPMDYWYNNSPAMVTKKSVSYLARFHKPVLPVGQGYDGRIDAPWLPPSNQHKELNSFMQAAKEAKVPAVSLWSWQTATHVQWHALKGHEHSFGQRGHNGSGKP